MPVAIGVGTGDQVLSEPDIIADARWFPEGFDSARREFLLVATDRDQLTAQSFLDIRWGRSTCPRKRVECKVDRAPGASRPSGIIWHTGFCCSTLLAKALDQPKRILSLCEPQVLVDIAEARRTGSLPQDFASSAIQHALYLLSRPFAPGERITIKPSPAANSLLQLAPNCMAGPMLFLYSDCRNFLISIYKMGEDGRKYIRRLFLALLADGHLQSRWSGATLLLMSDLELAAMVWHMQMSEFLRVWPHLRPASAASLDCDAFLENPVEALIRLDQFFSLDIGSDRLEDIVAGPLFRHNSKIGDERFDATKRADERRQIEQMLAADLDRIVAHSYQICQQTPRGVPLPNPLASIQKTYCPAS